MKYIRTKDGNYGFIMTEEKRKQLMNVAMEYGCKINIEIIKQVDTIEELIDLYVIVTEDGRHITMSVENALADLEDNYLRKHYFIKGDYVIYGAIWADRGLIYVAKMNDKGELELL